MNPVDALGMALTPGSVFNQQNKIFRSAKALAQFANVPQNEVLGLIADNLADRVTIRPSQKRPENGPLIALTEYLPLQEEPALVKIMGGNAVEDQPILGHAAAVGMAHVADGIAGGAEALMAKVNAITGQMDEDDELIGEPSYADEPDDEEVLAIGIDDPNDEEVA
jgi:hypothetical protein